MQTYTYFSFPLSAFRFPLFFLELTRIEMQTCMYFRFPLSAFCFSP